MGGDMEGHYKDILRLSIHSRMAQWWFLRIVALDWPAYPCVLFVSFVWESLEREYGAMREHLDCAMLVMPFGQAQTTQLQQDCREGIYLGGRLRIHEVAVPAPKEEAHILSGIALPLRRYDVCLLFVCPDNLPWIRTHLQKAHGLLATPVLALTRDLSAAALSDLLSLGIADFLNGPLCMQELRARCERVLTRGRGRGLTLQADASPFTTSQSACLPEALAQALENHAIDLATRGSWHGTALKQAKLQLIERFEVAYIQAALERHAGNITMAARTAHKHRRAFWALMRKYGIKPAPYRGAAYD